MTVFTANIDASGHKMQNVAAGHNWSINGVD